MAQSTRESRRARRPQRELSEQAEEQTDDVREEAGGGGGGAFSELKGVMSEAAVSVLAPVAKKVVTQAAKMAVERGPELLEDTVLPKLQDAGGKVGGMFGGGGDDDDGAKGNAGDGTGKGRRMPVQESVDVGAPLDASTTSSPSSRTGRSSCTASSASSSATRRRRCGTRTSGASAARGRRRSPSRCPCERIAWRSTSGTQTIGVVTFHRLSDRLTRDPDHVDFQPKGLFEKTASRRRGSRARGVKSDLMRFKAFIEMRDEATGEWRGAHRGRRSRRRRRTTATSARSERGRGRPRPTRTRSPRPPRTRTRRSPRPRRTTRSPRTRTSRAAEDDEEPRTEEERASPRRTRAAAATSARRRGAEDEERGRGA